MKIISKNFIEQEIINVGFSPDYLKIGLNKHKFINIKIFDLRPIEANILKQTALSCDCDCAVHRRTIDCKIDKTNCILSGTITQIIEVSKKLKKQPKNLSLQKISQGLIRQIFLYKKQSKSKIMGILNLTENSFSDGGEFIELENAKKHIEQMIEQGAQIIDIGAESTRPNADEIGSQTQIKRILPILKYIKENHKNTLVSIDTRSSEVAQICINEGVDIINDVSGLRFDAKMAKTIAKNNVKIVIMHSRSTPKDMDNMCNYENLIDEIYFELKNQCDFAISEGVKPENIIIDVGFGFAKNYEQNIELMTRIEEFKSLGYEILAGVSRKRFIQQLANVTNPKDADEMSAMASAYFSSKGIDYIRVHNVKKTYDAIKFGEIFNQ